MPGVSQAFSAPLIDQTGYYARYEIALDYTAFNFINSNQFYLLPNVTAFAAKGTGFSFPGQTGNTTGTTFLKAAWKPLSAAEINSGRYHTAQAFLFTPSAPNLEPNLRGPVTVGLVGLHIVHKTDKFGNYIWSTFEQVDNTPANPSNAGTHSSWRLGLLQPKQRHDECKYAAEMSRRFNCQLFLRLSTDQFSPERQNGRTYSGGAEEPAIEVAEPAVSRSDQCGDARRAQIDQG